MINPKKLEQFARQVQESLPKGIRDLGDDVEKKIRQVLQNQFDRMDLVSREKFDMQTQVLLRTREKLNELEKRLNALENMPKSNLLVSLAVPTTNKTVAKSAAASDMNDTTSISPTKQAVPGVNSTNNKSTEDTFKKL